jgi:Strictosidine synthase
MGPGVLITGLRGFVDNLLGRGEAAIAVPSFDGALKPNQRLEEAAVVLENVGAEDLATDGVNLYLASGKQLLRLSDDAALPIRSFDKTITSLTFLPGGGFAVALAGCEVRVYGDLQAPEPNAVFADFGARSLNALAAGRDGTLFATDGSANQDVEEWARDLLERGCTGRVFRLGSNKQGPTVIASGLRYAFGLCVIGDELLVSESWRHRVVAITPGGSIRPYLDDLPVYPSRLSRAATGGFWLTAFAARTQLIEFVLREPAYRKRMMSEIDPALWIAPRLRSGESFMEPTQGAHLKTMGVIKPWAPPRSYGLIIRLNAEGVPLYSLHSRVDGVNHGVVAAVECGDYLYAVAKGPGRVLKVSLAELAKEVGA